MFGDDGCANCMCLLHDDCCGTRRPFLLDDIAYCCEPCAVDGECECGCVADWAGQPAQSQTPSGPTA